MYFRASFRGDYWPQIKRKIRNRALKEDDSVECSLASVAIWKMVAYRRKMTAEAIAAMTSRTMKMYLLAASQEWVPPIPELKIWFGTGATVRDSDDTGSALGLLDTVLSRALATSSFIEVTSDWLGAAEENAEIAGVDSAGAFASAGAATPLGFWRPVPAADTPDGRFCDRNCPRHFFSSHSTHSRRPAEIGNPHATHLRKSRNTGGTWL